MIIRTKSINDVSDQLLYQVWSRVWNRVWNPGLNQVSNQVSAQIWDLLSEQVLLLVHVYNPLWNTYHDI